MHQCLDFTLPLDEFGDASITVDDVDNASTDACGIDTRSIDVTAFGAPWLVITM
ncbi:MAG: hypothetical protein R2778_09760 [Saprospiraceae bacterium]